MDTALLNTQFFGHDLWVWLAFAAVVATLLVIDLGVFNKTAKVPKASESLLGTLFYTLVAILFGVFIWAQMGPEKAMEFYTGYVMEQSLSLDNIFVISLIFSGLSIPAQHQHRVLFWGVVSVLVLRGIMIGLGAALIAQFHWVLSVFGVFLLITGAKMFFSKDGHTDLADNRLLAWMRKHFPITEKLHGSKFFVRAPHPKTGKSIIWLTPLCVVLILVEVADLVFAVDSVPAVFSITRDPFIVYTSNIFAILGLRTLYFSLAAMVNRFAYLSKALAIVLVFVGGKILYASLMHDDLPIAYSLGIVLLIIIGGIVVSLAKTAKPEKQPKKPKKSKAKA
jgi:tellurite resistance protein TerC